MKRSVRTPLPPSRSRARASTARTSSTRAETAESSSNAADDASATIRAIVVLPTPGGPWRIIDGARPSSIARRSAVPGPRTLVCPDQLVQRARAHALRKRRDDVRARRRRIAEQVAHAASMLTAMSATGEDYDTPILPGDAPSDYERYIRTDELLALQKGAGRVGAPRRAPVPGRPPVVGALAEARHERRRGGGAARRGGRRRGGRAPAPAPAPLPAVRHRPARHARGAVALGVPGDPQGARSRQRVRLARLADAARRAAAARAGVPRPPPRGGALARGALRPPSRPRRAVPPRRVDDRARRVVPDVAHPPLPRRRPGDRGRRRRDAGNAGRGARQARANRRSSRSSGTSGTS